MIQLPNDVAHRFDNSLHANSLPNNQHFLYKKWLRFYWDFCHKYHHNAYQPSCLSLFLNKLQQKRQTLEQQDQAKDAITLFYQLGADIQHYATPHKVTHQIQEPETQQPYSKVVTGQELPVNLPLKPSEHPVTTQVPTLQAKTGASWVFVFDQLSNEIKLRHYSPKTLKAYRGWIAQLQTFTKSKDYQQLSQQDVVDFLTFLAVKKQVSASSQNQAFNALLFLFKQVLKRDFGEIKGVVRAKRRPYIPVVLSRNEIDLVLDYLYDPIDLIAKLLYGCGLRLGECINLRVQCFNFDAGILTIHDGKGKKDRTVPLPLSLVDDLQLQLPMRTNGG